MKRKQSKHNQIKAHLESGRWLSGLYALQFYNLYRLSSVIHRLRNKGMKIKTTFVLGKNPHAFYSIID